MMTTKPKPHAKRFTVFTLNIGNTHTRLVGWGKGLTPDSADWKTNSKIPNLNTLLEANGIPGAPIVLAGVVPAYKEKLAATLRKSGRAVHIFRRDLKPRIKIVPRPPEHVGDDRIAAALGALVLDRTCPWVVVDVGTAMTINAVRPGTKSQPPRFEGGLIVPSAATSLRALNQFTAQLPHAAHHSVSRRVYESFIGRNTKDAMVLGVYHAQFAAAIALTQGQLKELGPRAQAVITGGGASFAPAFSAALSAGIVEDLVHLGLYAAWKQNEPPHG